MPVEIVEPRPNWAQEFDLVRRALALALGDRALRIDHIGSTSVPDLAAKDVIDIQITVAQLEPVAELSRALRFSGWVHRQEVFRDHTPPGAPRSPSDWAKHLFQRPPGERRMNVHVREAGRANQRYALLFRDYLRAHGPAAAAYAAVKRAIAARVATTQEYVEIKDPVFDVIMVGAERWAADCGWAAREA